MNWLGLWFAAIFLALAAWNSVSLVKWLKKKWHGWLEYLAVMDQAVPGMIRAIEEGYKRGEKIQAFKDRVLAEADRIIEESRSRNENDS